MTSTRALHSVVRATLHHCRRDATIGPASSQFRLIHSNYRQDNNPLSYSAITPLTNIICSRCFTSESIGARPNNIIARNISTDIANTLETKITDSADKIRDTHHGGKHSSGDLTGIYYAAVITPSSDETNTKVTTKKLSVDEIVMELGTHPRDFVSLNLTSLGEASRKRRAMESHYSVRNTIHPWFILPRESEIVVSCKNI